MLSQFSKKELTLKICFDTIEILYETSIEYTELSAWRYIMKKELHKYVSESTGNESNICQICAVKNGEIVYSDNWHGFQTDSATNVMSVTKGIMALLVGIAVDRGFIVTTSQKVMDFFPDYTVKRGEKTIYDVTLEHLLTMTAPYKYRSEPWTKVCTSQDWTKAALDLLGGRSGITGKFKYATLGIQILAGIVENASGMKCIDFANKYLFAPLGIPEHKMHGDSSKEDQFDFLMNKKPRGNEWYSDPKGTVTAGWGLTLSAYDMAKIGCMLIGGGVFENLSIYTIYICNSFRVDFQRVYRFSSFLQLLFYSPQMSRSHNMYLAAECPLYILALDFVCSYCHRRDNLHLYCICNRELLHFSAVLT